MEMVAGRLACFPSSIAVSGTPSVHRRVMSISGAPQPQTFTVTRNGDSVKREVSCLCYLAGFNCKFKILLNQIYLCGTMLIVPRLL